MSKLTLTTTTTTATTIASQSSSSSSTTTTAFPYSTTELTIENEHEKMSQIEPVVIVNHHHMMKHDSSSSSASSTSTSSSATTSPPMTTIITSMATLPRVVHFDESFNDSEQQQQQKDSNESYVTDYDQDNRARSTRVQPSHTAQSSNYPSMYLSPQELPFQMLSRSQPNSPIGSNVSIVGSLRYHHHHHHHDGTNGKKSKSGDGNDASGGGAGGGGNRNNACLKNLRFRVKNYSKRRGQERSIDKERQPSICSDSETDSINGQLKIEDIMKSCGNTTKKWSLPLPMVIRSSESDSASSSWSARSADEATEDERSPVPSPSASTHSNEDYLTTATEANVSNKSTDKSSANSIKATEESTTSTTKIIEQDENITDITVSPTSKSTPKVSFQQQQQSESFESNKLKKDKGKSRRKKKMTRAAESHTFQRMKTTNYGRCIICDAYVYFWGFECTKCQLICHKKCLKKMAIMCPQSPLPSRSSILNLELDALPIDEMVPLLIQKCTKEIERRALTRPGIYRMTGVASRVEKLLKSFESGPHLIDLTDVSVNDLTSVLKVFLRELKIPLINNNVYKEFLELGRTYHSDDDFSEDSLSYGNGERSKFLMNINNILEKLSRNHRQTLKHMCKHLRLIADHHEQNNMSPSALGIIFAPTFFRPRDTINDLHTEIFEAAPQARIIELMIRFYQQIFEIDDDNNVTNDDTSNDNNNNQFIINKPLILLNKNPHQQQQNQNNNPSINVDDGEQQQNNESNLAETTTLPNVDSAKSLTTNDDRKCK